MGPDINNNREFAAALFPLRATLRTPPSTYGELAQRFDKIDEALAKAVVTLERLISESSGEKSSGGWTGSGGDAFRANVTSSRDLLREFRVQVTEASVELKSIGQDAALIARKVDWHVREWHAAESRFTEQGKLAKYHENLAETFKYQGKTTLAAMHLQSANAAANAAWAALEDMHAANQRVAVGHNHSAALESKAANLLAKVTAIASSVADSEEGFNAAQAAQIAAGGIDVDDAGVSTSGDVVTPPLKSYKKPRPVKHENFKTAAALKRPNMVRKFIADGSGISAEEAAKLAKAEPELYQRYLAAGKTGGALDPALRDTIRAAIGQVPDPEGIAAKINRDVDGDGVVDVVTITNAGVATTVLGQATSRETGTDSNKPLAKKPSVKPTGSKPSGQDPDAKSGAAGSKPSGQDPDAKSGAAGSKPSAFPSPDNQRDVNDGSKPAGQDPDAKSGAAGSKPSASPSMDNQRDVNDGSKPAGQDSDAKSGAAGSKPSTGKGPVQGPPQPWSSWLP
jgi:hypothetical protein